MNIEPQQKRSSEVHSASSESSGKRFLTRGRLLVFGMAFLMIAVLCSLPRFGERENPTESSSDSDIYLDMAAVFTGDAERFNSGLMDWQPHHYNRPMHALLAGYLGKFVLGGNIPAAFSVIDILAATLVSILLMIFFAKHEPQWRFPWLPSVLYLVGFPQLNWGYHILSDGLGMATAFATAFLAEHVLEKVEDARSTWQITVDLLLLFACSAVAFLSRETGWLAVISTACIIGSRGSPMTVERAVKFGLILLAVISGKLALTIYSTVYQTTGVPLRPSPTLFSGKHLLDFAIKSAVAFHLAWLVALLGAVKQPRRVFRIPPMVVGWGLAGSLYMGAGFFVNKVTTVGYPLRMTYVLFPLVYYWGTKFFENSRAKPRLWIVILFCTIYAAIGFLGVMLDPGRSKTTSLQIFPALIEWFRR